MRERSFLDTDILIYSDDGSSPEKQAIANKLLASGWNGNAILSTQVLQEYFSAVTRKLGVPAATARRRIELLGQLEILSIVQDDILQAIDLHRLHNYSFWDSLIITMAQKSACRILYSEDMQDGQRLGNLRIVNPFIVDETG